MKKRLNQLQARLDEMEQYKPVTATIAIHSKIYAEIQQIKKAMLKKKWERLTSNNYHTEAAMLLVKTFGTPDEVKAMQTIADKHNQRGYIYSDECNQRGELSGKYLHIINK